MGKKSKPEGEVPTEVEAPATKKQKVEKPKRERNRTEEEIAARKKKKEASKEAKKTAKAEGKAAPVLMGVKREVKGVTTEKKQDGKEKKGGNEQEAQVLRQYVKEEKFAFGFNGAPAPTPAPQSDASSSDSDSEEEEEKPAPTKPAPAGRAAPKAASTSSSSDSDSSDSDSDGDAKKKPAAAAKKAPAAVPAKKKAVSDSDSDSSDSDSDSDEDRKAPAGKKAAEAEASAKRKGPSSSDDSSSDDDTSSSDEDEAAEAKPAAPAAAPFEPSFKPRNAREREALEKAQRESEEKLKRLTTVDAQGNDPCRVYIGGMPFRYTEGDIREYWEYCGEIVDVDMMTFPDSGRFRGIAFVTYKDPKHALEALKYDGQEVDGATLVVKPARPRPKKLDRGTRPGGTAAATAGLNGEGPQFGRRVDNGAHTAQKVEGYNVAYVANIAHEATLEEIREVFAECDVSYVRRHTDQHTGVPKGFAHVHFKSEEGLDKAIALHGFVLHGRALLVGYAQKKKEPGQ